MKLAMLLVVILITAAGLGYCEEVPGPLGVTSRSIGGGALNAYTPGVKNGVGLNNIGLLVRMWGQVTYKDDTNKFFYIDDGYSRQDGSGFTGVRVSYAGLAAGVTFTPPDLHAFVAVTGISSTWKNNSGEIHPNLRPRRDSDMQSY